MTLTVLAGECNEAKRHAAPAPPADYGSRIAETQLLTQLHRLLRLAVQLPVDEEASRRATEREESKARIQLELRMLRLRAQLIKVLRRSAITPHYTPRRPKSNSATISRSSVRKKEVGSLVAQATPNSSVASNPMATARKSFDGIQLALVTSKEPSEAEMFAATAPSPATVSLPPQSNRSSTTLLGASAAVTPHDAAVTTPRQARTPSPLPPRPPSAVGGGTPRTTSPNWTPTSAFETPLPHSGQPTGVNGGVSPGGLSTGLSLGRRRRLSLIGTEGIPAEVDS